MRTKLESLTKDIQNGKRIPESLKPFRNHLTTMMNKASKATASEVAEYKQDLIEFISDTLDDMVTIKLENEFCEHPDEFRVYKHYKSRTLIMEPKDTYSFTCRQCGYREFLVYKPERIDLVVGRHDDFNR